MKAKNSKETRTKHLSRSSGPRKLKHRGARLRQIVMRLDICHLQAKSYIELNICVLRRHHGTRLLMGTSTMSKAIRNRPCGTRRSLFCPQQRLLEHPDLRYTRVRQRSVCAKDTDDYPHRRRRYCCRRRRRRCCCSPAIGVVGAYRPRSGCRPSSPAADQGSHRTTPRTTGQSAWLFGEQQYNLRHVRWEASFSHRCALENGAAPGVLRGTIGPQP